VDSQDGQVIQTYEGSHTQSQYHGAVKFNNDNKKIIQASENGEIAVYDVSSKLNESVKVKGHNEPVISLDVNGSRVVSGSADQKIIIWNLIN